MIYLLIFVITFFLGFILTPFFRDLAIWANLVDKPAARPGKIHKKPVPFLGGLAVYGAFVISVFTFLPLSPSLWGLISGGAILAVIGIIDDRYNIPWFYRFLAHLAVAVIIVLAGIDLEYIRIPFWGIINLDGWQIPLNLGFIKTTWIFWSNLFAIIWIVVLISTVKFIDGLDGLASGIGVIASLVIFALSLSPDVHQPGTATLALILAAACLAVLIFNFNPARIYLGESGAFIGLALAVLSIMSGGKIATALLVLGIPILDVLWVMSRRILAGHSPFRPDQRHIHHRLLEVGLTHRQAVLLLYLFSAVFGLIALFSQTEGKGWALIVLGALMAVLAVILVALPRRQKRHLTD